jgi:hypothetical protein
MRCAGSGANKSPHAESRKKNKRTRGTHGVVERLARRKVLRRADEGMSNPPREQRIQRRVARRARRRGLNDAIHNICLKIRRKISWFSGKHLAFGSGAEH